MNSQLNTFLGLTSNTAIEQWEQISRREVKPRQEKFQPVEVLLCYGLFYILNPHSFGGSNIHKVPEPVRVLARTLKRTPGSLTSKMLNLDGSRLNSGRLEPELFIRLSQEPELFTGLYVQVIQAARLSGLLENQVPDFLGIYCGVDFDLLGQEELGENELDKTIEEKWDKIEKMSRSFGLKTKETTKIVLQKVRIGQHRFATQVMKNYDCTCAFCGFSPGESLKGNRLLYASHIKPWRVCNDRERMDVRNGVVACAIHDAAFDSGLLTINGGFRIHKAKELEERLKIDRNTEKLFGESMLFDFLLHPKGDIKPLPKYLKYHKTNIFSDG